jgi:thiol-disulfide isomerase/thioredoxin
MEKKIIFSALFFIVFSSCKNEKITHDFTQVTAVKTYAYSELKPLLEREDKKTYIVNFWATWCAPCVKELPAFEKINQEYKDKNVVVLLVSLDFPKQVEKKLIPFINRKKIQSKVVLLDDVHEDLWIKDIDSAWSGAIPVTLIYNANKRIFYNQSFEYETLEKELQTFLNL